MRGELRFNPRDWFKTHTDKDVPITNTASAFFLSASNSLATLQFSFSPKKVIPGFITPLHCPISLILEKEFSVKEISLINEAVLHDRRILEIVLVSCGEEGRDGASDTIVDREEDTLEVLLRLRCFARFRHNGTIPCSISSAID